MRLIPCSNHVAVERDDVETITPGGIVIPDTSHEQPRLGVVVAVGEGTIDMDGNLIPVDLEPGDHVLFSRYAGDEFIADGRKLLLMRDIEVLAKAIG